MHIVSSTKTRIFTYVAVILGILLSFSTAIVTYAQNQMMNQNVFFFIHDLMEALFFAYGIFLVYKYHSILTLSFLFLLIVFVYRSEPFTASALAALLLNIGFSELGYEMIKRSKKGLFVSLLLTTLMFCTIPLLCIPIMAHNNILYNMNFIFLNVLSILIFMSRLYFLKIGHTYKFLSIILILLSNIAAFSICFALHIPNVDPWSFNTMFKNPFYEAGIIVVTLLFLFVLYKAYVLDVSDFKNPKFAILYPIAFAYVIFRLAFFLLSYHLHWSFQLCPFLTDFSLMSFDMIIFISITCPVFYHNPLAIEDKNFYRTDNELVQAVVYCDHITKDLVETNDYLLAQSYITRGGRYFDLLTDDLQQRYRAYQLSLVVSKLEIQFQLALDTKIDKHVAFLMDNYPTYISIRDNLIAFIREIINLEKNHKARYPEQLLYAIKRLINLYDLEENDFAKVRCYEFILPIMKEKALLNPSRDLYDYEELQQQYQDIKTSEHK